LTWGGCCFEISGQIWEKSRNLARSGRKSRNLGVRKVPLSCLFRGFPSAEIANLGGVPGTFWPEIARSGQKFASRCPLNFVFTIWTPPGGSHFLVLGGGSRMVGLRRAPGPRRGGSGRPLFCTFSHFSGPIVHLPPLYVLALRIPAAFPLESSSGTGEGGGPPGGPAGRGHSNLTDL